MSQVSPKEWERSKKLSNDLSKSSRWLSNDLSNVFQFLEVILNLIQSKQMILSSSHYKVDKVDKMVDA